MLRLVKPLWRCRFAIARPKLFSTNPTEHFKKVLETSEPKLLREEFQKIKHTVKDVDIWNQVLEKLSCYGKSVKKNFLENDEYDLIESYFAEMKKLGIVPSVHTYNVMMCVSSLVGKGPRTRELYEEMQYVYKHEITMETFGYLIRSFGTSDSERDLWMAMDTKRYQREIADKRGKEKLPGEVSEEESARSGA